MKLRRFIFAASFIALAFLAGNRISEGIRNSGEGFRVSPSSLGQMLTNDALRPLSTNQTDLIVAAVAAGLVLFIWAYQAASIRDTRVGEEHGSANWGTPKDLKPFTQKPLTNNLLFTRNQRLGLNTHKTQRNLNALIYGSSGSGKSRYFVLPNLHQANTSYVVTDPKGELHAATARYLTEHGYNVRTLNLIDLAASETFNPFAYFSETQPAVDAIVLTENIISNTNGRQPRNAGDFWEKSERALLTALIAYVYFAEGEQGTLNDVTELLAAMSASEENERAVSPVDALFASIDLELSLRAWVQSVHTNGPEHKLTDELELEAIQAAGASDLDAEEVAALFTEAQDAYADTDPEAERVLDGLSFASSQYNAYTQGAGETKKSIIISLGVRLAPLHIPQVQQLLSGNTIDAGNLGQEKTALFLVVPDTHAAFSFLAAIFYEQLFETNIRAADQAGGALPIPIQCFMDEFANIGIIPSFERKIAVIRSRGISTCILLQARAQGKALYKDDWETIEGNCDSTLFLGGAEASTTEWLSKRLGKQTIYTTDNSESRGTSGSWSKQSRKLGRELLTQDELGRLPTNEAIYLLRGVPPFKGRKLAAPNFK